MIDDSEFTNKQLFHIWIFGLFGIAWVVLLVGLPQITTALQLIMMAIWSFMIIAMMIGQNERRRKRKLVDDIVADIRAASIPYKLEPCSGRVINVCPTCGRALGEIVQPGRD